jgi:hypothetical protein
MPSASNILPALCSGPQNRRLRACAGTAVRPGRKDSGLAADRWRIALAVRSAPSKRLLRKAPASELEAEAKAHPQI